jgi:hypothetical protein
VTLDPTPPNIFAFHSPRHFWHSLCFSLAQIHQANLSSRPNNSAGQNPEKQFYPSLLAKFFLRCLRSYSVPQNAQTAIAHGSFVFRNPIRQNSLKKYVRAPLPINHKKA